MLQHTTTIYLHPTLRSTPRTGSPHAGELKVVYLVNSGRGQRPRAADGAGLHGVLRLHRPAQRLPRGQPSTMGLTPTRHGSSTCRTALVSSIRCCPTCTRAFGKDDPTRPQVREDIKSLIQFGLRVKSPASSPSPSRASAERWSTPTAILPTPMRMSAPQGPVHRRRGADGLRQDRTPLLGIRDPGRAARYRHDGQGHRQWLRPPAVVDDPEIAQALPRESTSIHSGQPGRVRAGRAVLEVIDREGLQANSLKIGNYLKPASSACPAAQPDRRHPRPRSHAGIELVRTARRRSRKGGSAPRVRDVQGPGAAHRQREASTATPCGSAAHDLSTSDADFMLAVLTSLGSVRGS